ncbi:MAG TPA: aminoacyl-tRNA hydrolase [Vicinamibacteria bacterium]|nr:aminoacyl-tRNA hydrolase [Vicinamibacteria bacterium]
MVGLGNPGERYRRTRHNAGFMAVDVLAARARAAGRIEDDAWVAEATLAGEAALLAKPLAFMNASGGPVARLLAARAASPSDLLVVVDDVALDLGTVRVRERGSHGGHNGLRSVVETLGTEDFARVRIGIRRGELPADLAEYVLADFPPEEVLAVQEAVGQAADAVLCLLEEGAAAAMNRFNAKREIG